MFRNQAAVSFDMSVH